MLYGQAKFNNVLETELDLFNVGLSSVVGVVQEFLLIIVYYCCCLLRKIPSKMGMFIIFFLFLFFLFCFYFFSSSSVKLLVDRWICVVVTEKQINNAEKEAMLH